MGNSFGAIGPSSSCAAEAAQIRHYFSPQSWIEGAALEQLKAVAALPGVASVAAFPDLHPGKYGPTGIAVLSERLHPQLIGNDIGCGMSLFALDMPQRKLRVDRAVERMGKIEAQDCFDPQAALTASGLARDLFPAALGTIGGGNHFCELQAVEQVFDAGTAEAVDRQGLYVLVHSGSRGLGAQVFGEVDHHAAIATGLDPASEAGKAWLGQHDICVAWASLNRRLIAERAASALRCEARLVVDVPHNLVRWHGGFVHHKGSAAVEKGCIAPIAGSRASLSYVVRALDGTGPSLGGISHGAGRKYDRATMHGRVGRNRSEREALLRNAWGGQLICGDRDLVIEEAATAYKDAGQVVRDLADAGLVSPLAAMKPLVTYKKAVDGSVDRTRAKPGRGERGRDRGGRHERG